MSASCCVAFYGLRYEIAPEDTEALEQRRDPRQVAARNFGLNSYWGKFTDAAPNYVLLVGYKLGVLGPENEPFVGFSFNQLADVARETDQKLTRAGLEGSAGLCLEFHED